MPRNIKKILIIGAGQMAIDHFNVFKALSCNIVVAGRGQDSAAAFLQKTGHPVNICGIEKLNAKDYDAAVVAVGMEQLAPVTTLLLENGFRKILLEKPGAMNVAELKELSLLAKQKSASVLVAYNRRFYSSVIKAQEIIREDGGVTSFNFEFTEWSHTIEPLKKYPGVKENWLLANSSHVIDLAFYLGGEPDEINCYAAGKLSWHEKSVFAGAGRSGRNVLFSYQANWDAPGRWGVEVLTSQSRLIFRPLETLQLQKKGSVNVSPVALDDSLDKEFKPGLYRQAMAFLSSDHSAFISIGGQAEAAAIYERIATGR